MFGRIPPPDHVLGTLYIFPLSPSLSFIFKPMQVREVEKGKKKLCSIETRDTTKYTGALEDV